MGKIQNIKISQLETNNGQIEGLPKNPRFIKDNRFKALVKSIEDAPEMLDYRTLLVFPHDKKYIIIAGNMRFRACKEIGYKELPCYVLPEETPAEKLREYAIKDNIGFGSDDWDILMNEWDTQELKDWGMEMPDDWQGEEETEIEEDEIPEEVETRCKLGDVWKLGEHRLMCGDSTKSEDVEKLMNGEKADIAFTSPPYNAATTPTELKMNKMSKYNGKDDNKTEAEYTYFLSKYLKNTLQFSQYSFMNIQSLSNNKKSLIECLYDFRDEFCDTIIWDKQRSQPAMANNVLNSEFEYIHIFGGNSTRAIGTIPFRGTLSNILHVSAQAKNEYADTHNATFSVEFASFFVKNFAEKSVLDLFGGTGTTLIAAEQLNRKCFMMELDEHYCDVIIARWEKLTGKKAEKIN